MAAHCSQEVQAGRVHLVVWALKTSQSLEEILARAERTTVTHVVSFRGTPRRSSTNLILILYIEFATTGQSHAVLPQTPLLTSTLVLSILSRLLQTVTEFSNPFTVKLEYRAGRFYFRSLITTPTKIWSARATLSFQDLSNCLFCR